METINPEFVSALKRLLADSPYFDLIGMELQSMEPGRAVFELAIGHRHIQPWGVAHGGAIASVLDAACAWSVFTKAQQGQSMTTAELKVNYLGGCIEGQVLEIQGRVINLGRKLALTEAQAKDRQTGRLIAHATSTVMLLDSPLPIELTELPAKFV